MSEITRDLYDIHLLSGSVVDLAFYVHETKRVYVDALQLLDINISYEKWGGHQTAQRGDWIVNKNGETYTVAGPEFDLTYLASIDHPGKYFKHGSIIAAIASSDGYVDTLEGTSSFTKGDYIARNPTNEFYVIPAGKFDKLYQRTLNTERINLVDQQVTT